MGEILELANYYSLVNTMGMIHIHAGQVQVSDVAAVFNLYAPALPGEVLELQVEAPALTRKSKAVDACCLRTGETLHGFLVNFSATETAEVALAGVGTIREARGLRADAILSPMRVFVPVVTGSAVALPPMSLARVTCKA